MERPDLRYVETAMLDPNWYQCMEWKEPPTLPKEDRIRRLFLMTIFFDREDSSEDFSSEDLCTTLSNAFNTWYCPPHWSDLTIKELEKKTDLTEFSTRQLINELQKRGAMIKINPDGDDGVYGTIIACPHLNECNYKDPDHSIFPSM